MADWFWYVLIYSFFGFLMEVGFARATRCPKRDRKCRYFLPICPVYGIGAAAILGLASIFGDNLWVLIPCAAAAATSVEYLASLFYEKVMLVSFWDYSHLPLNLHGRVCLLFSGYWLILTPALLYLVQPWMELLANHIPSALILPAGLILAADTILTILLLRRTRDTESLRWYLHLGLFRRLGEAGE